jgi:hypothetical protein
MVDNRDGDVSPGGYVLTGSQGSVFGLQGWIWPEPRAKAITFFLDGTVKVSDQFGRPIKGIVLESADGNHSAQNREVRFAQGPPSADDPPDARKSLATHAQAIAALDAERVDWCKLSWAGWPQLPYAELKALADTGRLPPTPLEELRKIPNQSLRRDALRIRREVDALRAQEAAAEQEE